jgi:hypothetical protein
VATEGERPSEEAWAESERRHIAQRRAANRLEWISYYESQADRLEVVLGSLVDTYREKAARLRGDEVA